MITKLFRATIFNIIVALLIGIVCFSIFFFLLRTKIEDTFFLINNISIDKNISRTPKEIILEENTIKNYPEYGTKYAKLQIPKIDVNLDVFFGDSLDVLKNGVGHSSGSYFPGEGGSIIYMGHNRFFRRLGEIEIGDEIIVDASYGAFNYKIYDIKIINEKELDKMPLQKEEEILMLYTCYPFNNIGYTTQRYVIYAK